MFRVSFFLGFLSLYIYDSQASKGRGKPILIPLYHFHPLHQHVYISGEITEKSSPLHMATLFDKNKLYKNNEN